MNQEKNHKDELNPQALAAIENQNTIAKLEEEKDKNEKLRCQAFMKYLNKDVAVELLKKRPGTNNSYLPISYKEMILDTLFFGMWSTKVVQLYRELNHMVCVIEVSFKHPMTGEWLTRSGVGAVPIQQKSGSELADFDSTMIKTALNYGAPAAKAYAFSNACISIGKAFGRDVNRDFTAEFAELITPTEVQEQIDKINACKSEAELMDLAETLNQTDERIAKAFTKKMGGLS